MRVSKDMVEYALLYLRRGLSIIPIEYKGKKPLISWKEYQKRRPSEKEVREWFGSGKDVNIAIVCGSVSDDLMVIDFDSQEAFQKFLEKLPEDFAKIINKTWVVETGKGYHIYFRTPKPVGCRSFRDIGVDIRGEGGYVLAPPSVHPSGKEYTFKTDPEENDIYLLSEWELEKILSIFERKKKIEPKSAQKLTESQIEQIVRVLLPYWQEGRRHHLALMLAGLFYWHGYPRDDAVAVVHRIATQAKDDELEDRIRAVVETYERANSKNIAYKTWLEEAGIKGDEFDRLVLQLLEIVEGNFVAGNGRLTVRKSYNTLIVADYRRSIIKELRIRRNGEIVLSDTIATAVPYKVTVIQTEDSELLKVLFKTPEGTILSFEGSIEDVVGQLRKNTVRVTSRRKAEDALSLLISKMIQIGWCEVVRGDKVIGLVLNDGELVAVDYDMELPTPLEVKEALEVLNRFVDLSRFNESRVRKLAKLIKWFTVAGLGWIYKEFKRWLPHCYLYGESDTGKSKSAQILSNIWMEFPSLSLGSIDSPFRLGSALSQTTFPIVVNEMDFEALDVEVIELWKNAVEFQIARSRYGRNVKAYGIFCFTSNASIPSNKAIRKRLMILHFDPNDSEVLSRQKEQFEKLEVERRKLQAIGRFVANYVKANLDKLEAMHWEDFAELLLEKAYEYAGLDVPDWVKEKGDDEDEDVRTSKAEEIRAVIFSECARFVHEIYDEENAIELFHDLSRRIPWICVRKNKGDVILLRPLLNLLKQHGVKLASLRDLTYYIPNSEYKSKLWISNNRVLSGVVVDPVEFGKWLGFVEPLSEDVVDDEVVEKDWDLSDLMTN